MEEQQAQVVALPQRLELGMAAIGSMQVQRGLDAPEAAELGFICGSLPVPTSRPPKAFSCAEVSFSPQNNSRRAPQYRLLPPDTDLKDDRLGMPDDLWDGRCREKCDALAVSALSGHGDEIDVVAPVDILKQLFKTPYSKARVSVAVHRIGRTLILNSGPDEENLARHKKRNVKLGEKLLYSKFVEQSLHRSSPTPSSPSCSSREEFLATTPSNWKITDEEDSCSSEDVCATLRLPSQHREGKRMPWAHSKASEPQKSARFRDQALDEDYPETQQRTNDGFLKVLFWQFQNLRMLLGSNLLVFSNDKHVAVSLHLVDIEQQVNPLMWLDAWLDNVMASVPELAICYHLNGVVQGYELLKTDDIFLLKGLAEDGTVFFQPHVVQQNALSILKFLQDKCKHDPGTYWLYKNAGEDMFQLFDLTAIPENCGKDDAVGTLPSGKSSRANRYTLPLAMLLYRIAYGLSHSQESNDVCKCARLFRKCLEFLDHQEHLVIRAITHEQVARLILNCCREHGSVTKPILLLEAYEPDKGTNVHPFRALPSAEASELVKGPEKKLSVRPQVVADPIHARLAAVHHVSEAIISLRCQRQLQDLDKKRVNEKADVKQFPLCLCGGIECVTYYDIKSDEFGHLMDQKLRELVLMLSKCYLALGEAYKEDGQLFRAVEAAKLACSVYQWSDSSASYGCQYCLPAVNSGRAAPLVQPATDCELQKGPFWDQLWRLIGDVYVKNLVFLKLRGQPPAASKGGELQMAEEIVKEVRRLRKKAGQKPGCGVCSSSDCSCHLDRVSSGSSATSSADNSRQNSKHLFRLKKAAIPGNDPASSSHSLKLIDSGEQEQCDNALESAPQLEACRNHVCFHLQQVLTDDLQSSFLAALDCYDAAVFALTDVPGTSDELKQVLRKKGWACNELGRLVLAAEDLVLAEKAFTTATQAFEEVGDLVNMVLVTMNYGYSLRDAAEKLVALISAGGFSSATFMQAVSEARERYEKSLKCYREAKQQLATAAVSVKRENLKLEEEVCTQLANTYLRLGTFLSTHQLKDPGRVTADDAFLQALALYESVHRDQEAAYTHYHMGCHLLFNIQKQVANESKGLKRLVSVAERHLAKAAAYYCEKHVGTFLDVVRKQCDLFLSSIPFSNSYQMLEQALSRMLDARRGLSGKGKPPAAETVLSFQKQLQALLKQMLAATKNCPESWRMRTVDLKEMYRIALRSTENSLPGDLDELQRLWSTSY